jgi:hypothetical protein
MTAALHAVQPILAVARFAEGLRSLSWFAVVGHDLSTDERREAEDYLAAIGFPDAIVDAVPDWRAAEAATRDMQWSRAWWDAEERARSHLLEQASERHGRHALLTALSRVTLEASDVVLGAASIAAARSGIADPALARVAAGAAAQAAYQAALALAAEAGDAHPFAIKFRLFAAGRWPLGLVGQSFRLF